MRALVILFSVSICLSSKAQSTVDGSFIFKTHLFLEKVNVINIKGFEAKGGGVVFFFHQEYQSSARYTSFNWFSWGFCFLILIATKWCVL